jgi:hypothetical protein
MQQTQLEGTTEGLDLLGKVLYDEELEVKNSNYSFSPAGLFRFRDVNLRPECFAAAFVSAVPKTRKILTPKAQSTRILQTASLELDGAASWKGAGKIFGARSMPS